ncbi:receptor tyrosine-protein kinase erbB-3a isoform X3 [Denticeps clupeoides]|uniref:receptor tyrosine-protein kinase erbB-3a isoform X3 n=1 Tax=Denticeps clupeoides TaxID=299321 RepID=UPI0010A38CAC|nr:receptor tyrosine-protein kinase erbB-3 isoform X3 [Denticeps clupeoides]
MAATLRLLALCVALPWVPARAQTQEVVCSGTKNGLSVTGSTEFQYSMLKEMYTDCQIVMGNLEITQMEHHRDFSFLRSIREVTGYVLIALNQFSKLPLDQLRVIRGTTLYDNKFALNVFLNYQKDGVHGLQELGLTHLTEILNGNVQIHQNSFLSYAPGIDWKDIAGGAEVIVKDNGPELPCHTACKGPCWGPGEDSCQILTKTVCAPQCSGRCFGQSPSDCCHTVCAGGCTGPLDTDCFACRNFNNSGSCVSQCPQAFIYNKQTYKMEPNPNAKYEYGSMCVSQCPVNFLVDGSSCVSRCPSDKTEVEKEGVKKCEPCGGLCPKACLGTGGSESRQTVDSQNIDSFINCTKIQGSLYFLITGIEGDAYKNISALDPKKLQIFNTVREITDTLSVQSWPKELSDLSVFSNLQIIQGRSLYSGGYALSVMKIPTLMSLGLHSLHQINAGSVYINGNSKLCYYNTVNWTRIFTNNPHTQRRLKNIKDNKAVKQCTAEGHVCDPLCSSDGCWGPGPDQCVSCKHFRRGGKCVEKCRFLSGEGREFVGPDGECLPCHPQCKVQEGQSACTGPSAHECVACANLKDGPHCVSSCPEGLMGDKGFIYKYPSAKRSCEPCHANCTQRCTGPNIDDCQGSTKTASSLPTTALVLVVITAVLLSLSIFFMCVLYRRTVTIQRKRAMRRYLESGESFDPLEPGEKGAKVHLRILKDSELRKIKLLGSGVFGSVHKGWWIPNGDTVKLPVAIKTITEHTGQQSFNEVTDHVLEMGSLDHPYIVRLLGICPGPSLQLVTQFSPQGSLLEHIRQRKDSLNPQRLLNWCVQIAKGMYYLEEHQMVHRNLAARNVLLKRNNSVQIADYGIADLLCPDDKKHFYNDLKTPIKWMALESILFRRFTHQSDVWSYGVTVWEMMSYGAEPYASMRPQAVPDLLEKGERLSQPQICTIDVYMVMVKCWMIDENVRPTFKELANEFTRMARDPARYLVIKGDDQLPESSSDEPMQGATELNDLGEELEVLGEELGEQEEEILEDDMVLHSLSIRSQSRSVLDGHSRGGLTPSSPGYMAMTPSVDSQSQKLWVSRIRLNSTRTMSESSEGRGTMVDLEMNEDFSSVCSLKRGRYREDSAYISQRDSLSGALDVLITGTHSPKVLGKEDENGYVLPGQMDSPERETIHSSCEEYEYMNKLNVSLRPNHERRRRLLSDSNSVRSRGSRHPARSSIEGSESSGAISQFSMDDYSRSEDEDVPDPEFLIAETEYFHTDEEQHSPEYEYMDINHGVKKRPNVHPDVRRPGIRAGVRDSMEPKEEDELVDGEYQYMNRQPRLKKQLVMQGLKGAEGEVYEYEEMESLRVGIAAGPGDSVEYQNIQSEEEEEEEGGIRQPSGVGPFVQVRTGVGVRCQAGRNSFDNPDYWHSRMFQKVSTVHT